MKTIKRKHILSSTLLVLFFTINSYGQEVWSLLKNENYVSIYYQILDCVNSEDLDHEARLDQEEIEHQSLLLKIVNNNSSSKTIKFSKITKVDKIDSYQAITFEKGTTILTSCSLVPKIILDDNPQSNYPKTYSEFFENLIVNVEN